MIVVVWHYRRGKRRGRPIFYPCDFPTSYLDRHAAAWFMVPSA